MRRSCSLLTARMRLRRSHRDYGGREAEKQRAPVSQRAVAAVTAITGGVRRRPPLPWVILALVAAVTAITGGVRRKQLAAWILERYRRSHRDYGGRERISINLASGIFEGRRYSGPYDGCSSRRLSGIARMVTSGLERARSQARLFSAGTRVTGCRVLVTADPDACGWRLIPGANGYAGT